MPTRSRCAPVQREHQDNTSIDRDESMSFTNEGKRVYCHSSSNTCCFDRVVIVAGVNELDATIVDHDRGTDESYVVVTNPDKDHSSISRVLELMLLKRLISSPFLRTSTSMKEYTTDTNSYVVFSDQLHNNSFHPLH